MLKLFKCRHNFHPELYAHHFMACIDEIHARTCKKKSNKIV